MSVGSIQNKQGDLKVGILCIGGLDRSSLYIVSIWELAMGWLVSLLSTETTLFIVNNFEGCFDDLNLFLRD